MPFQNTKWDYIILFGAMAVFLYSFFTMEYEPIYSQFWENKTVLLGYAMKMGIQVILAPIIIAHRVMLIILGKDSAPRLREMGLKTRFRVFIYELREHWSNDWNRLSKFWKVIATILWMNALFWFCVFFYLIIIL